jgi:hypothetical protein
MRAFGPLSLLVLFAVPLAGQSKRPCTGEAPDSALLAGGPVYRDCEVDRPARLRTVDLPVDYRPPAGGLGGTRCLRAGFQFVVDTIGRAEITTVRPAAGNDRGLEDVLRGTLERLRYEPARHQGGKVRQVVVYARVVAPLVRVTPEEEQTGVPQVRSASECP